MTQARMSLCDDAIHVLCMSVTIAIRYSCVRQQSSLEKGFVLSFNFTQWLVFEWNSLKEIM